MQQGASMRGLSVLMAVVLWVSLFFSGSGLFFASIGQAADDDWEEVLEDGGKYDGDIELDEEGTYDPAKLARVDGEITISGDDITLRNVEVYDDLIIRGNNVNVEDVKVRGDVEIEGDEAQLEDVEVGGKVVVEGNDAELKRVTIEGDLLLEDVEDGFSGKNVTVKGTTFVKSDEADDILFEDATLNHLELDAEEAHVRLLGKTKVTGTVTVREAGELSLENTATIEGSVTINASESTVYLSDTAQITGTVTVNRASRIELEAGTLIKRLEVRDDDVELVGSGTIEALYVKDPDDVYIDSKLTIKAINEPVNEPSDDSTTRVEAGKAATVRYGQDVTVYIPEGATDRDIEVSIRETNGMNIPAHLKLLSRVYELKRNPDGTFKKPVTVSIAYQSAQLAAGEKPMVYYYDETGKTWRMWGGFADGGKMTVYVNRLATLAVMAEKVSSTPQPAEPVKPSPAFTDIAGHWAEKQILKAAELGIVKGYQDGTFRPDAKINRFEFAIMLARVKQLSEIPNAVLPFKDARQIPEWARGIIASAVNARLVLGDEAGYFRPTANLNRVQMAVMIARAAGLANPVNYQGALPYKDAARIPAWARGAVASVTEAGLMSGSNGQFMPQALATRAQVAAVLVRLVER
ncbi:MAG: S-layer homology domain-containing protein [Bacillota bacterium]